MEKIQHKRRGENCLIPFADGREGWRRCTGVDPFCSTGGEERSAGASGRVDEWLVVGRGVPRRKEGKAETGWVQGAHRSLASGGPGPTQPPGRFRLDLLVYLLRLAGKHVDRTSQAVQMMMSK